MNNKLITSAVVVTIGVILCASVLVPVLKDAESSILTPEENDGGAYLVSLKNAPITFSYTSEGYTLNDELIEADYTLGSQMCIISDKFIVASNPLNTTKQLYLAYEGAAFVTPSSVHCENGKLTYTAEGSDVTVDVGYSWIAYPANEGDYMYAGNFSPVNIDPNSNIIIGYLGNSVAGESTLATAYVGKGTVDNLIPLCYSGSTYTLATNAAMQVNFTEGVPNELSPPVGLSVVDSGTTYSTVTSNVFVPVEYHYQSGSDKSVANLISVIPLMVLVALLVGVTGVITLRKE